MTHESKLSQKAISGISVKHALAGGLLGLILITLFFFGDGPPFEFGFRVYFPTITTTLGGVAGGLFYSLLGYLRSRRGWIGALAIFISLVAFIVILWVSAVAGFAVTGDWD
ncbi:hypothetical protein AB9P05_04510 [Roseivirga sp. BDSF3-8]|uniref:hypothetical protein n=1 Tax=Roseivirga sp. BDSF3-8 TaxID=3241598 RepID=UPI003531F1EE